MGTPEFAVESLKNLIEKGYNLVGVVTVPDKPAGRGMNTVESAVKKYAFEKKILVFQPEKLRDENFIKDLKKLNPDIFVVVAFRMLPDVVWKIPTLGTFNLHASLLPQYRGAAPINWAIINNEKETGVTTFLIDDKIDTGNIIFQEKIAINETDDAGIIHDKLMNIGSKLVVKTVDALIANEYKLINQNSLISGKTELKQAPKINKEDCLIDWNKPLIEIYNHIRGLSPYPTAFTYLIDNKNEILLKIYKAEKIQENHNFNLGKIISDNKTFLKVAVKVGFINILNLQQAGKKRMPVEDFLRGFINIEKYSIKLE